MLWNASIKRSLLILRCMVPPSESHFDWGKMFLAQENCISRFARWQLAGLSNKFEHYFAKLPNRHEFLGCACTAKETHELLIKPAINCCCYLAFSLSSDGEKNNRGWVGFRKSYVIFNVGHGKCLSSLTRWVGRKKVKNMLM